MGQNRIFQSKMYGRSAAAATAAAVERVIVRDQMKIRSTDVFTGCFWYQSIAYTIILKIRLFLFFRFHGNLSKKGPKRP